MSKATPQIHDVKCLNLVDNDVLCQGFEARGTDIKGRDDAIRNLFGSSEVGVPGSNFNPRSERKKRQGPTGPTGCYYRTLCKALLLVDLEVEDY